MKKHAQAPQNVDADLTPPTPPIPAQLSEEDRTLIVAEVAGAVSKLIDERFAEIEARITQMTESAAGQAAEAAVAAAPGPAASVENRLAEVERQVANLRKQFT